MPRKCFICDKNAIVAAKLNDGTEVMNAFLCESCLHTAAKLAQATVVASAHPSYPVGYTEGKIPEKDVLDDFEFEEESVAPAPAEKTDYSEKPVPTPRPKYQPSDIHNQSQTFERNNKRVRYERIGKRAGVFVIVISVLFLAVGIGFYIHTITESSTAPVSTSYSYPSLSSSGRTSALPNKSPSSTTSTSPPASASPPAASTPKVYIPSTLSDSLMSKMWDAAKEKVKYNLMSPSTAKFEKYYSDNVKFIKGTEEDVKNGGFNVSVFAYVDSQNSYGAEIRTYFLAYFLVDSSSSFKIVDIDYAIP